MKIAIIGAGWYGCHIASKLMEEDFHVTVFEKETSIFQHASGKNQNRLHVGFHYARDSITRKQTEIGYAKFIQEYGCFTKNVENNLYLIPEKNSLLDYETYKLIMKNSNVWMEEVSVPDYIKGVTGAINTREKVILTEHAKAYFEKKLTGIIRYEASIEDIKIALDSVVIMDEQFDYLIDCTWGRWRKADEVLFEASLLLLLKRKSGANDALTFVDGDLCSLYPTSKRDYFTLSSVLHTPLKVSRDYNEVEDIMNTFDEEFLQSKANAIIEHMKYYYEQLTENWEMVEYQISAKTKPISASANRACSIRKDGPVISVMSGKIDTIFHAYEGIISYLKC
ncbi:NAD(P)/FAD-dependent oxidoreductase [Rhodobacteraceae bacterium]|nr:NAD(P)/FAD-dependent oxidoreductase [Paracoccaceae bacterium]